jgi:hypothetical protein
LKRKQQLLSSFLAWPWQCFYISCCAFLCINNALSTRNKIFYCLLFTVNKYRPITSIHLTLEGPALGLTTALSASQWEIRWKGLSHEIFTCLFGLTRFSDLKQFLRF